MKLSILTPSIPQRFAQVAKLAAKLEKQIGNMPVEHLILTDNRRRSIGAKRQALVEMARGEYVAFVDDDDDVSDNYVDALLLAITKSVSDVITFRQSAIYNGAQSEVEFKATNVDEPFNPDGITKRAPWHVCAWRREAIDGCQFGETNYGEDLIWCHQARRRMRTATHIDAVLHSYKHDKSTTAAPE